jgi:hypothetical protein
VKKLISRVILHFYLLLLVSFHLLSIRRSRAVARSVVEGFSPQRFAFNRRFGICGGQSEQEQVSSDQAVVNPPMFHPCLSTFSALRADVIHRFQGAVLRD